MAPPRRRDPAEVIALNSSGAYSKNGNWQKGRNPPVLSKRPAQATRRKGLPGAGAASALQTQRRILPATIDTPEKAYWLGFLCGPMATSSPTKKTLRSLCVRLGRGGHRAPSTCSPTLLGSESEAEDRERQGRQGPSSTHVALRRTPDLSWRDAPERTLLDVLPVGRAR